MSGSLSESDELEQSNTLRHASVTKGVELFRKMRADDNQLRMPRPGPLMPLPLDQFLLPARPSKRPHSPGGPTPFSPAKRRILNEEGLFSLDRSCKTPLPRAGALATPSRFSHVLAGPASPARILDFGLPRNNNGGDPEKRPAAAPLPGGTSTGHRSASSRSGLAPSPEIKPRDAPRAASAPRAVDPFDFDALPSPSSSPTSSSFTLVPRELPPQIDPTSVHYPGFVVFQDPHIVVYPPAANEPSPDDMEIDAEVTKENTAPRRRVRKAVTEAVVKGDTLSPKGTPVKKSYTVHDTPRGSMSDMRSPMWTPRNTIHKGMRQLMKEELDIGEGYPDGL